MKKLTRRQGKNFSLFGAAIAFIVFAMCCCATPVSATVTYQFDFSDLAGVTGGTGTDFSVTVPMTDYVATIGMEPLGYTITTSLASLGYGVSYFGGTPFGWFGFSDNGSAVFEEWGFDLGDPPLMFVFEPNSHSSDYVTSPGVWTGSVEGNAPYYFHGNATLTVTATAAPLPATLLLLGSGLASLIGIKGGFFKGRIGGHRMSIRQKSERHSQG